METKKCQILLSIILVLGVLAGALFYFLQIRPVLKVDVYYQGIADKRFIYLVYSSGKMIVFGTLERPLARNTLTTEDCKDQEKLDAFYKKLSDFENDPIRWWSIADIYKRWLVPVTCFLDICELDEIDLDQILKWTETVINQPDDTDMEDNVCRLSIRHNHRTVHTNMDRTREAAMIQASLENCNRDQNGRHSLTTPLYVYAEYPISKVLPRFLLFLLIVLLLCFAIVKAVVWIVRKISLVKLYRNHLFGFRT